MSLSFQEIAVNFAQKQKHMVDALTQNTPFLKIIPMEQASHVLWNMSEKLSNVTGAGFVEFDQAVQAMEVNSELVKTDLKIIGGKITCGQDKATVFGGKEKYFAKKMPALLRTSGQTVETDILTNSFRAYAIANSNIVKTAATTGDTCSSILAITFQEGEVNGLYPEAWGMNGEIFNIENLSNGSLYDITSGGIVGYGQLIKAYMGIQLLNPKKVSALVNIQSDKLPTATLMDSLLLKSEAGTGMRTVLVMHPQTYVYLKNLKNVLMTDGTKNGDIFTGFSAYDGVPIITTYNMPSGTETFVS